MSIVLFNSSVISKPVDIVQRTGAHLRIGIASIAAVLLENDIDVSILDPEAEKLDLNALKYKIQKIRPEVVGLPAYTEELFNAAAIAKNIKEVCPDTKIIIGGPHASAIPTETLEEFDSFDVAVIGEGEETFLNIVLGKKLETIKGIAYRENEQIIRTDPSPLISDLNSLPYPAWNLYDLNRYHAVSLPGFFEKRISHLELPVEGARGCPFNCIFCFRVTGRTIRFKSPERIVDEIERCIEFGADHIIFNEGTFGINKRLAIRTCDEIIKRGLQEKITWSTESRVDTLDMELLSKMKEAGCYGIGVGVESGDPEILKIIGKNIRPEQSIKIFEICKKLGIKTEANFILGLPFENRESILKTIELAKKIKADNANFAILVPFPGTEVYNLAMKNQGGLKIKTKNWRLYGKQLGEALEHENLSYKELKKLQMKAYRSFYLRPSKIKAFIERASSEKIIYGLKHLFV